MRKSLVCAVVQAGVGCYELTRVRIEFHEVTTELPSNGAVPEGALTGPDDRSYAAVTVSAPASAVTTTTTVATTTTTTAPPVAAAAPVVATAE
jgi:hypothetical protein